MEELQKPQENIEKFKKIIKEVNDYLDPILEKTFDLKSRKEYIVNNIGSFIEGMNNLGYKVGKAKLGDIEKTMKEGFKKELEEFKNTNKIIKDIEPEDGLNPLYIANFIRKIDRNNELEKKINDVYGIQVESWESFVMYLNFLKRDPFLWEELKKKSENSLL